jgi:formylglycine-generating enzyme required for sulfatase activity
MFRSAQSTVQKGPLAFTALIGCALMVLAGCDAKSPQQVTANQPPPKPCQTSLALPSSANPKAGMVHIQGGTFLMGASAVHGEEGPPAKAKVGSFWIDQTEVTNAAFARFVAATGYVTLSERPLDPKLYPQLSGDQLKPSSLVFVGMLSSSDRSNPAAWWSVIEGADWRRPFGPESSIKGMDQWPVVHIAYQDALAYAKWLGRDLATEAEWEYAARGGLEGKSYEWGDQPQSAAKPRANSWQGVFPVIDSGEDGYKARTASVGCYPANGFGLYDMSGNVWEWTKDWYRPGLSENPVDGPSMDMAFDPADQSVPKHVVKGGSYLCSDDFCYRYRPAARSAGPSDSGASHTGFRTIIRD